MMIVLKLFESFLFSSQTNQLLIPPNLPDVEIHSTGLRIPSCYSHLVLFNSYNM